MRTLILVSVLLLISASAFAQVPPVKNPTGVSFTSPDHATISGYEVDVIRTDNTLLQTIVTGKGTQDVSGTVTLTLNVQPIAFGTYTFKVRAVAGAVKSDDSAGSDPFIRAPGAPSKPTVK